MQLLKLDTPVMVGVALLFLWFFADRQIQFGEALVFLALILVYTLSNVWIARRQASRDIEQEFQEGLPRPSGSAGRDVGWVLAGLGLLVLGSHLFITGAVALARAFGVNEAIIGLTLVAAGTSLPELAASLMAAWRQQPDIALGNVVGSNIYNILAILGVSGLVASPLSGPGVSLTVCLMMVGISAVLMVIAWTGFQLRRWEGALLLTLYGAYLAQLWPRP